MKKCGNTVPTLSHHTPRLVWSSNLQISYNNQENKDKKINWDCSVFEAKFEVVQYLFLTLHQML